MQLSFCQYSDRHVNIQIDSCATLVPKCQYSDRSVCNIGTQITKCQYSDRSVCNIGTQMSIFRSDPFAIHLAGAAIRTRNHNYEDRNYDLNAHPHIDIWLVSFCSLHVEGFVIFTSLSLIHWADWSLTQEVGKKKTRFQQIASHNYRAAFNSDGF